MTQRVRSPESEVQGQDGASVPESGVVNQATSRRGGFQTRPQGDLTPQVATPEPSAPSSSSIVDPEVEALVQLFDDSDLTELSIRLGNRRIVLRKPESAVAAAVSRRAAASPPGGMAGDAEPSAVGGESPAAAVAIKAHMVGMFYWTRDKRVQPAITIGQAISHGQVVGYIEAMDIMNEIESPIAGQVAEIMAVSGQPVQYGQPLMALTALRAE